MTDAHSDETKPSRSHDWERGINTPVPKGYAVVRLGPREQYPMKIERDPLFGPNGLDFAYLREALIRLRERAADAGESSIEARLREQERRLDALRRNRPDLFRDDELTLHTLRDEDNAVARYSSRMYAIQFLQRYAPPEELNSPSPDTPSER